MDATPVVEGAAKQPSATPSAGSTVVVVSSGAAANSVLSAIKGDSNDQDAKDEDRKEEKESIDATELTRDQWLKVLCVT